MQFRKRSEFIEKIWAEVVQAKKDGLTYEELKSIFTTIAVCGEDVFAAL
jgi:hypothetical protein